MTINHVLSVSFTLFFYFVLAVAFYGIGIASVKAIGITKKDQIHPLSTFHIWLGFAVSLFLFKLIHFFSPINIFSVLPILIIGIASFFFSIKYQKDNIFTYINKIYFVFFAIILFIISVWIASRSMLKTSIYDSNLYHYNYIRWINTFPVVPGLGNLHGRLAFNQSFFTYVAALNLYPVFGQGRAIANSSILIFAFLTFFEILISKNKNTDNNYLSCQDKITSLFLLPILVFFTLFSNGVDSPSPDLASSVIQLIVFLLFVSIIYDISIKNIHYPVKNLTFIVLATTLVTIKLSNLIFSCIALIIIIIIMLKQINIRYQIKYIYYSVVIFIAWFLNGVIISGYPFYPSTLCHVNLSWSLPVESVVDLENWVYSWARQPGTHWKNVLGNWNWLYPWMNNIIQNHYFDVVIPLYTFVTIVLIDVLLLTPILWFKKRKIFFIEWVIIFPLLSGLLFWFFTAPDPRFANAVFMLLPVSATLVLLFKIKEIANRQTAIYAAGIFFTVECFCLSFYVHENKWVVSNVSLDGWQKDDQPQIVEKITKHGLRVYTTLLNEKKDQCFDAPLPCTPYFNENLRLRRAGDLASGFIIQEKKN